MSERINHYHKCSNGHEFGHDLPPDDLSDEEYHKRHDCPICGENVRNVSGYPNDAERERRESHDAMQFLDALRRWARGEE